MKGGYRTIRATCGTSNGIYYWECEILEGKGHDSHVRVGWSTQKLDVQGPVGFDKNSFAYRDINGNALNSWSPLLLLWNLRHVIGSKISNNARVDGYGEKFQAGDVVGCYIRLDSDPSRNVIRFFKNGTDQGIAYEGPDIPSGNYFPSVSLYNEVWKNFPLPIQVVSGPHQAAVRVNFGPFFILKHDIYGANPFGELQPMSAADRWVSVELVIIRQL